MQDTYLLVTMTLYVEFYQQIIKDTMKLMKSFAFL